jgi:hypothetical protein
MSPGDSNVAKENFGPPVIVRVSFVNSQTLAPVAHWTLPAPEGYPAGRRFFQFMPILVGLARSHLLLEAVFPWLRRRRAYS